VASGIEHAAFQLAASATTMLLCGPVLILKYTIRLLDSSFSKSEVLLFPAVSLTMTETDFPALHVNH
jgi:hypothetical protein